MRGVVRAARGNLDNRESARAAREVVEALAELGLDEAPLDRVLDLACADVRPYSRECMRRARHYYGLDLLVGDLAQAAAAAELSPGALLLVGNGEHLPFRASSLDMVVMNCALAYCDKERILSQVRRVLRPGGYLLCLRNNTLLTSLYRMKNPQKGWLMEWAHSLAVILNTAVYFTTGRRPFRTTFSTLRELVRRVESNDLELVRAWTGYACEGFPQHNVIARRAL